MTETLNKVGNKGFVPFLKRNATSIILVALALLITFVPSVKASILQGLGKTGLFNVSLKEPKTEDVNFSFETEDGTQLSVSDLKGKVVFINFWASWCPPCKAEMPSIQALYEHFKDNPKVYFLLLNEDKTWEAGRNYLDSKNFTFPMQSATGAIPNIVFNGTLPTTLVLDKQGRIRLQHKGFRNYSSDGFIQQMDALVGEQ